MAKEEKPKPSDTLEIEILHPIDHGTGMGYTHYDRGVHTLPRALAEEFLKLRARVATPKKENEGRSDERVVQVWGTVPIARIYDGPKDAPRGAASKVELAATQSAK